MKPTRRMLWAVKLIAQSRGDYKYTFWSELTDMSFEQASNYIRDYGRKVYAK